MPEQRIHGFSVPSMSDNNRHTGDFMDIAKLRRLFGREEIDYQLEI